jgi:spore maturation protein CgeB
MHIAFFASSLVSAYWNGAATYYRGIVRALDARGHRVTFFEPHAYERQQHRDIDNPTWAEVVVYQATEEATRQAVESARDFDLIVKASGVGVHDALLEAAVLDLRNPANLVAFWDVDAPATLDRVRRDTSDPFLDLIPRYDVIFTYGGGHPVIEAYEGLGARQCVPIYNALDPEAHFPTASDERFRADLAFLGNRLPDREARVDEFFFKAARKLPEQQFLLGGAGWGDKPKPPNVRYVDHVSTRDHNALNCSARAVLNVSRESMARFGYSPATRVFEAAGAGACIVTDLWEGIGLFLEPGREVLVADDGKEVAGICRRLTPERARDIGRAGRRRVLAEHTYARRAAEVEAVIEGKLAVAGVSR